MQGCEISQELGSKSLLVAEHWKRKHRDKTMEQLNKQNHDQARENRQDQDNKICHRRRRRRSIEFGEKSELVASRFNSTLDGPPTWTKSLELRNSPLEMPFESLNQAKQSASRLRGFKITRTGISPPRSSLIGANDSEETTITNDTVNRIGTPTYVEKTQEAIEFRLVGMQTNAKTIWRNRDHCRNSTMNDGAHFKKKSCKKLRLDATSWMSQKRNYFARPRKAIILLLVQETFLTFLLLFFLFSLQQQQATICLVKAFNQDQSQQASSGSGSTAAANSLHNNIVGDPRPTIYSGQISFGLLLSAHSSMGAEIVGSASHQIQTIFALEDQKILLPPRISQDDKYNSSSSTKIPKKQTTFSLETSDQVDERSTLLGGTFEDENNNNRDKDLPLNLDEASSASLSADANSSSRQRKRRTRRQIFHNTYSQGHTRKQSQSKAAPPTQQCSQVNPNALYAGMGAIWASHQANLVADSHFTIGTYVYDSCNDADVGQRQSVRIVSNLNAFQQTTCESPRGSPISLTIAHGDDQVKAIHLLTSFRVPVISTKEHFAQEAYGELNNLQRKYLFSTAPSSRHLALGALRFARRVAAKSASSPKLPNRLHKSSSRNGLVVISRDLPQAFINYLTEFAPQLVNYELLATKLPIDQISSIQRLESIFMKSSRSSSAMSESRLVKTELKSPINSDKNNKDQIKDNRSKRSSFTGDSLDGVLDGSGSQDASSASDESSGPKMLSPTILMFITPAEAIDLITRLRNNMAEVSKYYSLIIVTREDITPALKTIFQRGGSSLCSGKAFYTISPKPDDMSEFSRYFRDTVHIEGETSDHPLICEYAKHSASSRIATDYDDVSAEPVIKAVWAAAAAFKQVHGRECGALVGQSSPALNANNFYKSSSASSATVAATTPSSTLDSMGKINDGSQQQSIRSLKSRQSSSSAGSNQSGSNKSPHSECMMKMSKSMSQLVQRALKKINVSINSTGLQSLDGFQVSFDDLNELNSNKFSIRHINKECEIEEIGQYTGLKGSQLHLDNEAISKSLESTLPDAWPVSLPPSTTTTTTTVSPDSAHSTSSNNQQNMNENNSNQANQADQSSGTNDNSENSNANGGNPSWLGEQPASTSTQTFRRKRPQNNNQHHNKRHQISNQQDEPPSDSSDEETGNTPGDSSLEPSFRHKTSKRSKAPASESDQAQPRNQQKGRVRPAPIRATTTSMTGRAQVGLTDSQPENQSDTTTSTISTITTSTNRMQDVPTTTVRPMRKLMPYPSTEGAKLKDWIPRETPQGELRPPTTRQPVYQHSTLPESGGNTDLEIPALLNSRAPKVDSQSDELSNKLMETMITQQMQPDNSSANSILQSSDFVTMASAINQDEDSHHETTPTEQNNKFNNNLHNVTLKSNSSSQPSWALQKQQSISKFKQQQQAAISNIGTASTTVSSVIMKPFGRQGFSFDLGDLSVPNSEQHENEHNSGTENKFRSPFRDLDFSPVALSSEAPSLPITTTSASTTTSSHPRVPKSSHSQADSGPDQLPTFRPGHSESQKSNRSKFRSHLRRIYNSWFGLAILIANILGAIMTLYVLTFLLMKNCDGSLNRENQNVRSMHLLAIIVVFFGSTLFIVSPTPGLCLLRASWHNFALVLLFGCLLSQTMQTRSLRTLGLGGRPNRLNQFLNLVFLVGVQVSFELQRWKYESANYLNFVNQYFGSPESDQKKLMILGNAIENQFNPLDSFNDLVTPVSIQVSEKYQSLLQDYCIQQTDDFMQSQIYLCIIVFLAILFSFLTRNHTNYGANHHHQQRSGLMGLNRTLRSRFLGGKSRNSSRIGGGIICSGDDQMLAAATAAASLTSGKLVASEHEANLNLSSLPGHHSHHHHLGPSGVGSGNSGSVYQTSIVDPTISKSVASFSGLDNGMVFIVSLLNGFIYGCSILLHIYGQNNAPSRDLISSITMVLIAFVTLIGVFLPILNQIHRSDKRKNRQLVSQHDQQISSTNSSSTSSIRDHIGQLSSGKLGIISDPKSRGGPSNRRNSHNRHSKNLSSNAFTMFPEFSPTGLKRPTSVASLSGGESGSLTTGSSSRKPFAETKESRRKMGFTLANLAMDQQQHSNYIIDNQHGDLRPMGFYDPEVREALEAQFRDSSIISMKLNETSMKEDQQQHHHHPSTLLAESNFDRSSTNNQNSSCNNNNSRQLQNTRQTKVKSVHRLSKEGANMGNEKRLIMLDVDPCCPKHGNVARQHHHNHSNSKMSN